MSKKGLITELRNLALQRDKELKKELEEERKISNEEQENEAKKILDETVVLLRQSIQKDGSYASVIVNQYEWSEGVIPVNAQAFRKVALKEGFVVHIIRSSPGRNQFSIKLFC